MSWLRRVREALGLAVPIDFEGLIPAGEDVHATATTDQGGRLAVTPLGLWVPAEDGVRRIGWHLISKATWSGELLTVTEAEEVAQAGDAVILAEATPLRLRLERPGKLPRLVREHVDGSIRARHYKELTTAGAWFVVRKVPGTDGVVVQALPAQDADPELVADIARETAERMAPGD